MLYHSYMKHLQSDLVTMKPVLRQHDLLTSNHDQSGVKPTTAATARRSLRKIALKLPHAQKENKKPTRSLFKIQTTRA